MCELANKRVRSTRRAQLALHTVRRSALLWACAQASHYVLLAIADAMDTGGTQLYRPGDEIVCQAMNHPDFAKIISAAFDIQQMRMHISSAESAGIEQQRLEVRTMAWLVTCSSIFASMHCAHQVTRTLHQLTGA